MAQAATKTQSAPRDRAKTLHAGDSNRHPGETPAERKKRLKRNAYTRNWRANRKAKERGEAEAPRFLAEPQRVEHEAEAPRAVSPFALSAGFLNYLPHVSASDVRSTLRVLMKTHERQVQLATPSDPTQLQEKARLRGIVDGLRMALSMMDGV